MARPPLRDTGIDVIGRAPWGTHFCQFYQTKQDLIDTLVPYFKAGLLARELCMWITAPPLVENEAVAALREALPDLDRYLERGQIEIIPYDAWYLLGGTFDSQRVLDGWVEKEGQARSRGFDGLRLTGNTFWLEKANWRDFAEYEEQVNNVIGNYSMIAACTYSLEKCGATEIVDVISTHQFALIKRDGRWETIQSGERKRLEEKSRETEEALLKEKGVSDTTIESLPGIFYLFDADGRFLRWNKNFERVSGYSRAEVARMHPLDFFEGDDKRAVEERIREVFEKGESSVEAEFVSKDGFATPHFFTGVLTTIDGRECLIGMGVDISERKKAEDELKRANAVKDDFIGMVSHEMRTPLTAIMGSASLLLDPTPFSAEERRELIEDIRAGASRLAAIIDNMLTLARADSRRLALRPLDLCAVVDEQIARHCERYASRELRKAVTGGTAPVTASKEYLAHVLQNLLENAEKYTPQDRAIDVEVRREGRQLAVRVLDRGIGLEPEEMENIFDPFYRSPRVDKLSSGVGIGLTVSKRLVEAMGGRIWALPREGGGSEFGFALPVASE